MPRYSDQKKKVLDALLRDEVYRVAVDIITSESLMALTMDRVAAGVGVSRGTLYNHFKDRDDVVDFIKERTFDPILISLQEIATGDLPADSKLEAIARWIFTSVERDFSLVIALVPENKACASRESQQCRHESVLASVQRVIQEGIDSGAFRDLSPLLVSEYFLDVITGRVEATASSRKLQPVDELVTTLMAIFLGGLRKSS